MVTFIWHITPNDQLSILFEETNPKTIRTVSAAGSGFDTVAPVSSTFAAAAGGQTPEHPENEAAPTFNRSIEFAKDF